MSTISESTDTAGFEILAPARHSLPLVLASPHSGRRYPARFLRQARLRAAALRRSEDSFVDELMASAPARGVPLLRALFPRTYVDVNREPFELDPAMFADALPGYVNSTSPRVRSGLGTIPRVAASGAEIYSERLRYAEERYRIRHCYLPYHKALRGLLRDTRARFGYAVLLDCHSMPSQAAKAVGGAAARDGLEGVDIVLGDCHGTTCSPLLTGRAEQVLRDLGYTVTRNRPYAGGFTTKYYGRPNAGLHALQIEINRALYMDEGRLKRGPRLADLATDLGRLITALGETELMPRAAE